MMSCCGLNCLECKAFVATKNNDEGLRAEVAKEWSEQFNVAIPAEAIHCTGCLSTGVKFYYCESLCEVRKCALARENRSCKGCSEIPCEKLTPIFAHNDQARQNLLD